MMIALPCALLLGACLAGCGEPAADAPNEVLDGTVAEEETALAEAADGGKTNAVAGAPLRHPLVLIHGFPASPARNGVNQQTVAVLCRDGHQA